MGLSRTLMVLNVSSSIDGVFYFHTMSHIKPWSTSLRRHSDLRITSLASRGGSETRITLVRCIHQQSRGKATGQAETAQEGQEGTIRASLLTQSEKPCASVVETLFVCHPGNEFAPKFGSACTDR